ncbi:MAG: cobalamin biosynthesis protein [Gammaproteobacteria bacterium]|nr:MAG: cobalamin biosynthesis protein [Gammaproteobacteria bacterium]
MQAVLAISLGALLLDRLLGEPPRWHPLVGFGRLAQWLESRLHAPTIGRGTVAAALLLLPPVGIAMAVSTSGGKEAFDLLILYLALGGRSLEQHALAVRAALEQNDLPSARRAVACLVSRETTLLDREGVSRAAVESVLENGNDAVFGSLFWFLVAGAPGVVLHRLANTLDALWGYRIPRYEAFGKPAARLDDLLNWIPARLTALSYALVGDTRTALACWRCQGTRWKSPNAGPVMAAGAGALGIRLGGPAHYHGREEPRPALGRGRPPRPGDIDRALRLIRRAVGVWLLVPACGVLIAHGLA